MSNRPIGVSRIAGRNCGVAIAATLTVLLGGCDVIIPPDDDVRPPATVWVFNGTSQSVLVKIDGETFWSDLPAASTSGRVSLGDGAGSVRLEPATGSALTGNSSVALPRDGSGSGLGITYVLALETPSGALQAALLNDSLAVPSPAGFGKLRVIHLALNAPPIDVWLGAGTGATPFRLASSFDYGEVTEFHEGVNALWRVSVTPRTTPPAPGSPDPIPPAISITDVFVASTSVRTVLVYDAPGGGVKFAMLPLQSDE